MFHLIQDEKPLKFDSLGAIDIIEELEESGLRKDIYLFEGEEYEPTYDVVQFFPELEVKPDSSEIDDEYVNFDLSLIDTSSWETFHTRHSTQLRPEERKREEEREQRRIERKKWSPNSNPSSLYHYALLKSDSSFVEYCWLRYDGLTPAITQTLTDFPADELENWKIQLVFVVDYYFSNILFRYRKYMEWADNTR